MNTFSVIISFIQLLIGIYIHFKKMNVAKKKKEITWELEIYHSVTCIIYFTWVTVIDVVNYTCPAMEQSIESFINQTTWILRTLGTCIIISHSFSVALYKYYIIVNKRPILAEDKKIKLRYLLALILYPIIGSLEVYLKNLGRIGFIFNASKSCYSEEDRSNTKSMKELFMCSFDDGDTYKREHPIFYILSEIYCVIWSIIRFSIASNIIEILVYNKIFTFAKSQLSQFQANDIIDPIIPDNSTSQDRDIKKLLLNAQITAMLSALESLGFAFIFLLALIMDSYAIASFSFRLLENIALPYLYLINTQENRNRIMNQGWKEFFRNLFHFHAISFPWTRSNLVDAFEIEEVSNKNEIVTISQRCDSNDKYETKEEILHLKTLGYNMEIPFEENPSTSDNGRLNCDSNFSSEGKNSRDISGEDHIECGDTSVHVRKRRGEILDGLILSVEEEMEYLQLFARFIFLENCKYEDSYLCTSETIDSEMILQRIMKLSAGISCLNRSEIRREKLKQLKESLKNENHYQTVLSQLIDIEEEFIDD